MAANWQENRTSRTPARIQSGGFALLPGQAPERGQEQALAQEQGQVPDHQSPAAKGQSADPAR
jgi:hypothetical protein